MDGRGIAFLREFRNRLDAAMEQARFKPDWTAVRRGRSRSGRKNYEPQTVEEGCV